MSKIRSIIISGDQAQDHEFIYPYYRMLEEGYHVDVCIIGGKPVKGILGTSLPPYHRSQTLHHGGIWTIQI